jgi:hypothetical protein
MKGDIEKSETVSRQQRLNSTVSLNSELLIFSMQFA